MKKFDFCPEGASNATVTAYLQPECENTDGKLPAVVICPGGAYCNVSDREGEPVAKEFLRAGYNVFVLKYSVGENAGGFVPLIQLCSTVSHIRKYSNEFFVDDEKIAVCGFSAGGHLVASSGTLVKSDDFRRAWGREDDIMPNAMILCYPVIVADEYAHTESIKYVSNAEEGSAEYKKFGLTQYVDSDTPPTFLWHTASDDLVPVENSLAFSEALSKSGVPFELHIFPSGSHGMSVCTEEVGTPDPYNRRWIELCFSWLNRIFHSKYKNLSVDEI